MSLTKEQILNANDLPVEEVEVPQWGGSVFVRTMTASERDTLEGEQIAARKSGNTEFADIRARIGARCIVDADGKRLFSETEIGLLGQKSSAALDLIFEAAQRLNGMSDEDIEELEKN